jgi:hypothetical protein
MKTPMTYCLRVRGHLDQTWSAWFDGFTIAHQANGETTLTGTVPDQAALYGLLTKARDLGLELVAVLPASLEHHADADELGTGGPDAPTA